MYIKKVIAILLVMAVGFPHFWAFEVMATASTQRELNEVNRQLRELENLRNDGLSEYLNLREDLQNLRDEMRLLDIQMGEVTMSIQETTWEIAEVVDSIEAVMISLEYLESEIKNAEKDLEQSREDLKIANEILAARIRAMHENGQVNIITVLLNSESITDFLMRFDDLRSVIRFNRDFLQNLTELEEVYQNSVDRLALSIARQEDLQFNLEMREQELIVLLMNFEILYGDLERQRDEKDYFIVQLLEDAERYEQLLDLLEAEHYELQRRLGNLHARFDRERASADFRHALPGAQTAQQRITPPVSAAGAGQSGGFIGSTSIFLTTLERDDWVLDLLFSLDMQNAPDAQELAHWREVMSVHETRVSPREDVLAWPVPSHMYVNIEFANTAAARHEGIDIAGQGGAPIVAAADGRVIHSEWTAGAGHMVIVEHDNGLTTVYAHNSRNHVSVGDVVSRGQHIADVGSTGPTRFDHVHFEVLRDGVPVDPMQFFR